jgi:putative two-component system protein, hydrogenase maturation factor HypX/HoxX
VGFRVGLLSSSFGSMAQAFLTALQNDGQEVVRPEDLGFSPPLSAAAMERFAERAACDVLFCPFLKERVPAQVCQRQPTWIAHPGPPGDAGPSSLAWAIFDGEPIWGLTMVKAEPAARAEELDSGNVGAWQKFRLPPDATMAEAYAQYCIPAAVACARQILDRMATDPGYRGVPLAECPAAGPAQFRGSLKQDRLAFDWDLSAEEILRRVRAAPFGARTTLAGQPVNVYDAHGPEPTWFGPPPDTIVAHRDGAVLVATGDGQGVWVGQAKIKPEHGGRGLKLPALHAVRSHLNGHAEHVLHPHRPPHAPWTHQVIRYRKLGPVGWIDARPYNGAASTEYCRRLLDALEYAAAQDTTAIVVAGGRRAWGHGIHLSVIEAAANPAKEAWANIQKMDDVAEYVFHLSRGPRAQTTIAVLGASAGAGGAVLSACFDHVLARPSIVLNYHYRKMGLPGSELRSLVLPQRAGDDTAARLLADCLPISAATAHSLGLVDAIGPEDPDEFHRWAQEWAQETAAALAAQQGPSLVPVDTAPYRHQELREMHEAIFGNGDGFADKRRQFLGVAA